METEEQPSTVRKWTVYTVHYTAPRDDQRLKAGERNFFQSSSKAAVWERLAVRGIDPQKHDLRVFAEHFVETSHTTDETGDFR